MQSTQRYTDLCDSKHTKIFNTDKKFGTDGVRISTIRQQGILQSPCTYSSPIYNSTAPGERSLQQDPVLEVYEGALWGMRPSYQ